MDNYLIVGCGLSGVVIAERIANKLNKKVTIIEKRDHIGGNCYDYTDKETNILINKYGAHLFHTNNEDVWKYINQFDKWVRWEHKVLTFTDNKFVPIPVNITTINQLCEENLQNENDVNTWLEKNPHAIVSMAIFDMDVYKPTKDVLEKIIPRLTKGSLLVFDELNCQHFPGETTAVQEVLGLNNLTLQRHPHQSYCAWAVYGE
jgi:UDP-galactopyranose mutase